MSVALAIIFFALVITVGCWQLNKKLFGKRMPRGVAKELQAIIGKSDKVAYDVLSLNHEYYVAKIPFPALNKYYFIDTEHGIVWQIPRREFLNTLIDRRLSAG
jgi:hypothetical protein